MINAILCIELNVSNLHLKSFGLNIARVILTVIILLYSQVESRCWRIK